MNRGRGKVADAVRAKVDTTFKNPGSTKGCCCDEWFTPEMLMEQCPKLGLVVDLTNTNRYYNGQALLSLVRDAGFSAAEAGRRLGVHDSTARRWVRLSREGIKHSQPTRAQDAALAAEVEANPLLQLK
ncbi:hypothetical protein ANN_18409 [Periplaneta americana]|uniref:Helix-turn-helix domain-containing protein n=1 Tax=Periplaneta americana TaxID=6978 RepID=A0ABQ8SNP7_PERAM|nr:hypothetical protein ANN_18409 [Periplaneta americana]